MRRDTTRQEPLVSRQGSQQLGISSAAPGRGIPSLGAGSEARRPDRRLGVGRLSGKERPRATRRVGYSMNCAWIGEFLASLAI